MKKQNTYGDYVFGSFFPTVGGTYTPPDPGEEIEHPDPEDPGEGGGGDPGGGGTLPAGVLSNPPVSAKLGVFNHMSSFPFVNMFKCAWGWSTTGFGDYDALVAAGHITAKGDLISIPPTGDQNLVCRVLHEMHANSGTSGRWRFTFTGSATFSVFGGSNHEQIDANTFEFDYVADSASWVIIVFWTIESGPISNFKLVHEDDLALDQAGDIFRPAYLDEVHNYRVLRFDDWGGILDGGLRITDWSKRATPDDAMFVNYAPYEWMAELCNKVGADMWVCMPSACTDDYVQEAAELIQSLMPAPRHVYIEYATKTWDFAGTPQAHYCAEQGRLAFNTDTGQEFLNWYGMRSAQIAKIWKDVWGPTNPRLHTVIQTQCDWLGNEDGVLNAPMWLDAFVDLPLNHASAVARSINLRGVSEHELHFTGLTSGSGDSRFTYTFPRPVQNAVIEFDITCSGAVYLRADTETGLEAPFSQLWTAGAGTHHVRVTMPAAAGTTILGFLAGSNVVVDVTNWRVTEPGVPEGLPIYFAPHTVCDILTVHAQIDGGMAYGGRASDLNTWRTTLTQTEAFNRIRDQMLTGMYFDTEDINQRNILRLTPKWEYFRDIADTYGMQLACYEVGNHLNGVGGPQELVDFMHAYAVSPQMAEVYTQTFAAIRAAGFDGPLCMSVDIKYPDWNIMNGLQRWAGDHNPAWTAVNAINVVNDGPAGRSGTSFVGTYPAA